MAWDAESGVDALFVMTTLIPSHIQSWGHRDICGTVRACGASAENGEQ